MILARLVRTVFLVGLLIAAGQISPTVNYYEALASLSIARTLRVSGFPGTAIRFYSFAMYCAPQASKVVQARGVAYYQMGNFNRAIADLSASLKLDPKDTISLEFRAAAYSKQKRYEEAISDYSAAVSLAPDKSDILERRAHFYRQRKDYNRAIDDLSALVRLNPNKGLYYYLRADAFLKNDKPRDALSDLGLAIQMTNGLYPVGEYYLLKARAHTAMGEVASALASIDEGEKRACRDLPASIQALPAYARCFKPFVLARDRLASNGANPGEPPSVRAP